MFARAASGTVLGIDALPITVEAHRGKGLPGMSLIGMARGAVKESLVRVRSAIIASGLQLGNHRLVLNLLPAELPKEAAALDLPLALALCAAAELIPVECLQGRRFFGELSLGGGLEPVRGAVLLADLARRAGDHELILPAKCAPDAAVIPNVRVLGATSLAQVIAHLDKRVTLPTVAPREEATHDQRHGCLSEVFGQSRAKRALEISAAGGHNLLLIGPPGSGKTMLARRLPGILPPLTPDERIEVTRIHSAALPAAREAEGLRTQRPFRAPHHTASEPAMCGGGVPRPGEVTLAHRGVLFLDELPEFQRRTLECLREPLEEGYIQIARASMSLNFPADVLLIAAMNPCPCGRALIGGELASDNPQKLPCMCGIAGVDKYRGRVSGPLLDRIDMHVPVHAVGLRALGQKGQGDTSEQVRERVLQARNAQYARYGEGRTNASMGQGELKEHVPLTEEALSLLEDAMTEYGLSTRALGRIRKVARTVADLSGSASVESTHLQEAIEFRILDRQPPLLDRFVS